MTKKARTSPALAVRVRRARLAKSLTQAKLGELAHIHHETICRIECARRDPSLASLVRLANALDVSTDYLLNREPIDQILNKMSTPRTSP